MSKKELNAWDRFWVSVKANEKVIWVGLLVILAPTFAFPISSYIGGPQRRGTQMVVFGEKISGNDYHVATLGLRMVAGIRGPTYSPFISYENPYGGSREWRLDVPRFLVYEREAERIGIRVSDQELGAQIRRIYAIMAADEAGKKAGMQALESLRAAQAGKKDALDQQSSIEANRVAQEAMFSKFTELQEREQFTDAQQEDWYRKLQDPEYHPSVPFPIERRDFEEALRRVLKAEKLEEYVRNSVQVKPDEVVEEFKKEEQSRKFSFFEVRADDARAEIEKSVTPEEVKQYFDKNRDEFEEPLSLRTEYLYVPLEAFADQVTVTDEDLKKEYEKVKVQKYQTFVGDAIEGNSDLLSPEEKAARDQKAFRPFEEVKEEVRTQVEKQKRIEATRAVTDKIRERLFPPKQGAISDKKEEKPAPQPATMTELAKEFPMVKTGTTPWVTRRDAEKTLPPEVYSSQLMSWFTQAERNLQDKSAKKEIEAPKSYITLPNAMEPKHFIFYQSPQIRPPGVPKLEEIREKVREALVKEKLFERAREKAKELSAAVREGKKTFDDAAKEAGKPVVTTAFVDRTGTIKVPLSEEEKKKAEAEAAEKKAKMPPLPGAEEDEPAAPKEKDHLGSRPIIEFGFKALHEKGKVDGFAEDPSNSACYVVRWDDQIFPDMDQFEKKRQRYQDQLLREKQTAYVDEWRKDLYKRADLRTPVQTGDQG
jgi:hypothetical protein